MARKPTKSARPLSARRNPAALWTASTIDALNRMVLPEVWTRDRFNSLLEITWPAIDEVWGGLADKIIFLMTQEPTEITEKNVKRARNWLTSKFFSETDDPKQSARKWLKIFSDIIDDKFDGGRTSPTESLRRIREVLKANSLWHIYRSGDEEELERKFTSDSILPSLDGNLMGPSFTEALERFSMVVCLGFYQVFYEQQIPKLKRCFFCRKFLPLNTRVTRRFCDDTCRNSFNNPRRDNKEHAAQARANRKLREIFKNRVHRKKAAR